MQPICGGAGRPLVEWDAEFSFNISFFLNYVTYVAGVISVKPNNLSLEFLYINLVFGALWWPAWSEIISTESLDIKF